MTDPVRGVSSLGIEPAFGGLRRTGEAPAVGGPSPDESFRATLSRALGGVQSTQDRADAAVGAFLRGEPVELHDVMAAVEEAGIALEMLIQVRDRLIEAYRTVSNMQG